MALCHTEDVPRILYATGLTAAWLMAALLGPTLHAIGRRHGRSGWQAAGIAVMSVPAWMVLIATMPDMVKTFCAQGDLIAILPGRPAGPPSNSQLLASAADAIMQDIGYTLVGLLLWLHGRGTFATSWTEAVRPLVPVWKGLGRSALVGVAFFPLLAAGNLLLVWLTRLDIGTAGPDPYFANMTVISAVALALAAGVGEELVFRGVMQQGLKRIFRGMGAGPVVAVTFAVVLQSIPFAYAHADYGNPTLLLFNVAFALLAGVVTERFGIACAIALHVLIDFFGFALASPDLALRVVAVVSGAAILGLSVREAVRGARARRGARGRAA